MRIQIFIRKEKHVNKFHWSNFESTKIDKFQGRKMNKRKKLNESKCETTELF